jgi:hypothetical protein
MLFTDNQDHYFVVTSSVTHHVTMSSFDIKVQLLQHQRAEHEHICHLALAHSSKD